MEFRGPAVFLGLAPRSRQSISGSSSALARRRAHPPLAVLGMGMWLTAHLAKTGALTLGRWGQIAVNKGSRFWENVVLRISSDANPSTGSSEDEDARLKPGELKFLLGFGGGEQGGDWRQRLKRPHPLLIGAVFLITAGVYFFGVGRNRYQVISSFIVRLPQTPESSSSSLLGTTLAGPTMLGSLEDGRFLAVYLTSPEVMKRVFLRLNPEKTYAKSAPDPFAGLNKKANFDQQLEFFRRQVFVVPQDLTGVINLTTFGLDPQTSYKLNQLLLGEAETFLNITNQDISKNQQTFAEQEVATARARLDKANADLTAYKDQFAEVDVTGEALATSEYINQLESKLVDLKVEEAALKRQFKDPTTPEVLYVTDQIRELEIQIAKEKEALVSPQGQDYNRRISRARFLESEVAFATEALKQAMTFANNRRQETQKQIKFLVRLSEPQAPAMQSYDWRIKGFLAAIAIVIVAWGVATFTLGVVNRK